MDWMDYPTTKTVPITSAVPTSFASTSTFDMTQLKMAMSSK